MISVLGLAVSNILVVDDSWFMHGTVFVTYSVTITLVYLSCVHMCIQYRVYSYIALKNPSIFSTCYSATTMCITTQQISSAIHVNPLSVFNWVIVNPFVWYIFIHIFYSTRHLVSIVFLPEVFNLFNGAEVVCPWNSI